MFKEYTRCPRVCALDNIYMKKIKTDVSIYNNEDRYELIETLATMFDCDSGEDLINVVDPQLEALLPYYNELERHAMEIAERKFGGKILYSLETKKQKSFSFTNNKHQFYCYLDGFLETNNDVKVFEVKATTSKNFTAIGPKIKGKHNSIFNVKDNVIKLIDKSKLSDDKFIKHYKKLFNRYNDAGKYIFDLAIERYIIENSRKQYNLYLDKSFKYYLVVLNSDYIFNGEDSSFVPDTNGNELVTFIDLTAVTSEYQIDIINKKNQLIDYIETLNNNVYPLGEYCERKRQSHCRFVNSCWKNVLEEGSILEYSKNHHGFKDNQGKRIETIDLINQGFYKMDSIPVSYLHRQNNIIERDCYDNDFEYVNYDKISKGLNTLQYPLYYLDFESFPCPIPRYKGEGPYNQSVFQYSLHVERERGIIDKDRDHFEFLAPDDNDHRLELVERLISDIDLSKGGTVIVYNKSFEQTRIKEFIKLFPQYKEQLEKINNHIFDLLYLISTNFKFYIDLGCSPKESKTVNYYNKKLQGSYSIKKVLPLFSELSYASMNIGNGTEAIAAYANFKNLCKEDLEKIRDDLIEYCKQDTWAMVIILWGLYKKVEILKNTI